MVEEPMANAAAMMTRSSAPATRSAVTRTTVRGVLGGRSDGAREGTVSVRVTIGVLGVTGGSGIRAGIRSFVKHRTKVRLSYIR
ncbi:hypothetical protein GCM10009768_18080 [Leucobacter iarius]|uniref:Uncharacterized protein n=1 Tax=Leucobacter iarius TaxID=333963 RepID=A0ABN2LI95_9MICO